MFLSTLDLSPWLDLVGLTPDDITDVDALQFQNGDSADIWGVELAWVQSFDMGLLFGVNATFTDSDADFRGRSIDLPQSSDEIYNLMVGYENYGIQARLAYNFTGERLVVVGDRQPGSDVYQDDHGQWDLSLKYDITSAIQVYFEAINITDEPYYASQGQQPLQLAVRGVRRHLHPRGHRLRILMRLRALLSSLYLFTAPLFGGGDALQLQLDEERNRVSVSRGSASRYSAECWALRCWTVAACTRAGEHTSLFVFDDKGYLAEWHLDEQNQSPDPGTPPGRQRRIEGLPRPRRRAATCTFSRRAWVCGVIR